MEYRWLTDDQIMGINPRLQSLGLAVLNPDCCRVIGAWSGDRLIHVLAIQLFPVLGPAVKLDAFHRDNGEVLRELTNRMSEYLSESQARGVLVIADSPVTGRLCERWGLVKMSSPVYTEPNKALECNNYTQVVQ